MSYKFSKGSQIIGDLKAADDTQRDTLIDFGEDQIDLQTSGTVRLNVSNDGVYIPDTSQNASLFVSGGIEVTPGNQEGLRFMKSSDELNFISFQDGTDGGSFNARMSYNSAEFLFIAPGRGADFFINSAENSGDTTFPFSIMDDGTARFEKGLTSTADRAADLASDIAFYVSGTTDGNNNAVFVGNVVMSGSLKVGDAFTFPTSDGLLDQVLATDGNGTVSWVDPAGGGGGGLTATSDSKVLIAHMSSTFNVTTTSTNEYLTVPFNSVLKNSFDSSDFDTSTYTFTAPEEGYYFINCSLYHESINTSAAQYQVRISSSAGWASGGAIAFRNYFPAGATENSIHVHRLDRIAHLSGSDEVKVTIRPVGAAGTYGTINSLAHVSYFSIQKLEYVKREEIVVTGSTSTALDSTYNGGTVIITPLGADVTYTLPEPEPDFKVKFLAGTNLDNYNLIFKTKLSSQKIFGMFYRISQGGDGDTGYDLTPQSYVGAAASKFVGGASEDHKNTVTIDNALQGSEIDFYSDGVYWYVKGEIVAAASNSAVPATITFSSGSY